MASASDCFLVCVFAGGPGRVRRPEADYSYRVPGLFPHGQGETGSADFQYFACCLLFASVTVLAR